MLRDRPEVAKNLLLSPFPPALDGPGGAISLYSIAHALGPELTTLILSGPGSGGDFEVAATKPQFPPWLPTSIRARLRSPLTWLRARRTARRVTFWLATWVRPPAGTRIIVPLDSPFGIALAARVSRKFPALQLRPILWDPPAFKLQNHSLRGRDLDAAIASFRGAVGSGHSTAVMTREMGVELVSPHGGAWQELRLPLSRSLWQGLLGRRNPALLRVALAGSVYCPETVGGFIEALRSVSWQVAGVRVELHVYGSNLHAEESDLLFCHPWLPLAQLLDELHGADLCYLPYWLDADHLEVARLAFPAKLSVYLASGRPIFVHAPEDASTTRFASRTGVGVACASLDPGSILEALGGLLPVAHYSAAVAAVGATRDRELDMGRFSRHVAAWLAGPDRDPARGTPIGIFRPPLEDG